MVHSAGQNDLLAKAKGKMRAVYKGPVCSTSTQATGINHEMVTGSKADRVILLLCHRGHLRASQWLTNYPSSFERMVLQGRRRGGAELESLAPPLVCRRVEKAAAAYYSPWEAGTEPWPPKAGRYNSCPGFAPPQSALITPTHQPRLGRTGQLRDVGIR